MQSAFFVLRALLPASRRRGERPNHVLLNRRDRANILQPRRWMRFAFPKSKSEAQGNGLRQTESSHGGVTFPMFAKICALKRSRCVAEPGGGAVSVDTCPARVVSKRRMQAVGGMAMGRAAGKPPCCETIIVLPRAVARRDCPFPILPCCHISYPFCGFAAGLSCRRSFCRWRSRRRSSPGGCSPVHRSRR